MQKPASRDLRRALRLMHYRHVGIPARVRRLRRKDMIRVAFVVWSLGAWKSEPLYQAMLRHPRFEPILIIGRGEESEANFKVLHSHCLEQGYDFFIEHDVYRPLYDAYRPDIIIYMKPYRLGFLHNLKSLFCYVPYGAHSSLEDWHFKTPLRYNCWQIYYENAELARFYTSRMGRGVHNGYATGLPAIDELLTPREQLPDPWPHTPGKKRIIYAPHHSVDNLAWWQTSTFLTLGPAMLRLARKYSDRVQWVFKPHPLLRDKLTALWGKERTDIYYDSWAGAPWSSLEEGKYLALFKHSDAMIHDCGAFVEEYHVTGNPVMYLERPGRHEYPWNSTYMRAFDLHRKASTESEIEQFIIDVIEGRDTGREERIDYFNTCLRPPGTSSATDNIINAILGQTKPDA